MIQTGETSTSVPSHPRSTMLLPSSPARPQLPLPRDTPDGTKTWAQPLLPAQSGKRALSRGGRRTSRSLRVEPGLATLEMQGGTCLLSPRTGCIDKETLIPCVTETSEQDSHLALKRAQQKWIKARAGVMGEGKGCQALSGRRDDIGACAGGRMYPLSGRGNMRRHMEIMKAERRYLPSDRRVR